MADDAALSRLTPVRTPVFPTARALHRRLILLYVRATVVAVGTTVVLSVFGLEFTPRQYLLTFLHVPFAAVIFIAPDIWLIARHFRPIGDVLRIIERGGKPGPELVRPALVRALNLPFYSYLRVTFLHGPLAGVSAVVLLVFMNWAWDGGFQGWQMIIFMAVAMLFASPAHAIIEFFSLSRTLAPVIEGFWTYCDTLDREHQRQLIAVGLKSKLMYLCVFITALPLLFIAFSIIFKVDLLLGNLGVHATSAQTWPLWTWTISIVVVCMASALAMAFATASGVSHSASLLAEGMNQVQSGNLQIELKVTATDEYADLYRGFNHMLDGLRDEVKMMEVAQDLAGELQLDVLIGRIMRAATDLLDADRATLFVVEPDRNELYTRYADGMETHEIRIPVDAGIAGHVYITGKAENIANPYSDPRFNPTVDQSTGYTTRSILCMPIFSKTGRRIGVTQVLNKKDGPFTVKDEQRLRAFTAQIAVSLENARLFDEVLSIKNYNENILASTTNGVMTLDTRRWVTTANNAALNIIGIDGIDMLHRPADEVFGDANAWVARLIDKVLETGASDIVVDSDLLRPDGTHASVNLTANPLMNAESEILGVILSFEDFTSEKRVKSTMARYMSPEVADQLLEAGEAVLGGRLQPVSILFSDVRGFTTLSESLGARETVSVLNEYFAEMVEVVFQHRGILDKYIGDAIMALFGSPFPSDDDADNVVATANDMVRALRRLNARRAAAGHGALEMGIGIATGDVVVGNIGSPRRMEYTVIGDSVNLASRLESATKLYGVPVLLSESTVAALRHPARVREVDRIRPKGQDRPVTIYEALDHFDEETFPRMDAVLAVYAAALEAYRRREWKAAISAFEDALVLRPDDRPSQIHLERCAYYEEHPPAPHWDGVWTLREK